MSKRKRYNVAVIISKYVTGRIAVKKIARQHRISQSTLYRILSRNIVRRRRSIRRPAEIEEAEAQEVLGVKESAIDKFDEWAKENMKGYGFNARREILHSLNNAKVSEESDGTIQLNALGTKGGTLEKNNIKLRFDPNQKKITIYIREWSTTIR